MENDDIDELGEGIEISHLSCIVYLESSMKKDEMAYLAPDKFSAFP